MSEILRELWESPEETVAWATHWLQGWNQTNEENKVAKD